MISLLIFVIPAKAGTHFSTAPWPDRWIPAFAGMTSELDANLVSPVRQVERVDRAAHVVESELAVIRGADAHPGAFDDGLSHWPQPGAPMDAALQHNVALLQRVDAEGGEAVEIRRLDMARDQRDLDR